MSDGLVIEGIEVHRSGTAVVRDVSLVAPAGQVTVLLGANGAGKTTLLESVSGIIGCTKGTVTLAGKTITGASRSARARMGLAHVEQGRSIFPDLTCEENLLVAGPRSAIGDAFALFPELDKRRAARAALLSGGEQQMLVIARALVNRPTVLMLDEMSLGLAPTVIKRLIPIVRKLADDGVGILLVEQFAALALSVGDQANVLVRGEIAFQGTCASLRSNPSKLRELYLGASAAYIA
jgi:branched-chain amino acid transport system ATP-binding protein